MIQHTARARAVFVFGQQVVYAADRASAIIQALDELHLSFPEVENKKKDWKPSHSYHKRISAPCPL